MWDTGTWTLAILAVVAVASAAGAPRGSPGGWHQIFAHILRNNLYHYISSTSTETLHSRRPSSSFGVHWCVRERREGDGNEIRTQREREGEREGGKARVGGAGLSKRLGACWSTIESGRESNGYLSNFGYLVSSTP